MGWSFLLLTCVFFGRSIVLWGGLCLFGENRSTSIVCARNQIILSSCTRFDTALLHDPPTSYLPLSHATARCPQSPTPRTAPKKRER